jgi:hypothetical protein
LKHALLILIAVCGCKKVEPGVQPAPASVEFTRLTNVEIYIVERGGFCFAVAVGTQALSMVQVPCVAKTQPPAEAVEVLP